MKKIYSLLLVFLFIFILGSCDFPKNVTTEITTSNGEGNKTETDETGPLATPIFSYNSENNVITWNPVEGADGYELSIDGETIVLPQMIDCTYRPTVSANKNFEFKMRALAPENSKRTESSWSRALSLSFEPKIEKISDNDVINKARELRIGYGYNFITKKYFDVTNSSTTSIVDLNKLFETATLNSQSSSYTKADYVFSDNIRDFQLGISSELNSEVSVGGAFDIFSANVSAGLSNSSSIDFSSYQKSGFLNCYSYAEYKNYQVLDYGTNDDLANIISSDFKSVVNKNGSYANYSTAQIAEYLLNTYGTHLILGVKTGGRLDYYYSFATNKTEVLTDFKTKVTANAKAGIAGLISGSTNNSISAELKTSLQTQETENRSNFEMYGGSTSGIEASNISEKFISWSSSINDTNARSIGVANNGIVYLPDLIKKINPTISDALDKLIMKNASSELEKLFAKYRSKEINTDVINANYANNEMISLNFDASVKTEGTVQGNATFKVTGIPVLYNGEEYIYGNAYYKNRISGGTRFNDVDRIMLTFKDTVVLFGGLLSWCGTQGDSNESGTAVWDSSYDHNRALVSYLQTDPGDDFAGNENVNISIVGICIKTGRTKSSSIKYPVVYKDDFTAKIQVEGDKFGSVKFDFYGIKTEYNSKEYAIGTAYANTVCGDKRFNDMANIKLFDSNKEILIGGTLGFKGSHNDFNECGIATATSLNPGKTCEYMMENGNSDFPSEEKILFTIVNICIKTSDTIDEDTYYLKLIEAEALAQSYAEDKRKADVTFNMLGIETSYNEKKAIYGFAHYSNKMDNDRLNDCDRICLTFTENNVLLGGFMHYTGNYDDWNTQQTLTSYNNSSTTSVTYYAADCGDDFPGRDASKTTMCINGICLILE